MGRLKAHTAENWHEIAVTRARDVGARCLFSLLIAVSGEILTSGELWPLIWFAAANLAQLLTLVITEPMRRDPQFVVSRRRERVFFVGLGLSAAIFASSGALLWLEGGWGGRVMGVVTLAGGAVNVALQAGPSARLLWTACAPFMILLLVMPLSAAAYASEAERGAMGVIALACSLFVVHLATAGQRGVATYRKLDLALRNARSERARAEAASRAKSDFLGVMSHELRTPLNGVLGMAQAMAAADLSPDQRERLKLIRDSGEHLLMLVNDVLDISDLDAARLELEDGVIEPRALAQRVQAVFAPIAEAKGLVLSVRCLRSAGSARAGDPERVRQVLHNLISNAVRRTESGRVSVVIRGSGEDLVLEVSDAGPGLVVASVESLFGEPRLEFEAGGPAPDRLGVGLGIACSLARRMGGDVAVAARPGVGSIFTATLRARVCKPELPARSRRRQQAAPCALAAPLRVLAAEDNPTNQMVLKTLLEHLGLAVHIVGDGAEAVEAWRGAPWDLVLMDIRMPGLDGIGATCEIRRIEGEERRPRTPIIAVTADATSREADHYMAAGMDGLAPKPLQLTQLAAVIEDVLTTGSARPAERLAG